MMLLIYGITFLLEAFIALQYFEWVFDNAKYAIGKRFAYILLAYSVLFGIFQMKILVLNMVAFPICNWFLIRYLYQQYKLNAFFQSILMSVIMNLSEVIVVAVCSGFSHNTWANANGAVNVLFLSIISKFLYFLVMFAISRYGKNKNIQLDVQGWTILIIPFCVLIVISMLNYMCAFYKTSPQQEKIVLYCSLLCLVIIIISFVIYGYLQNVYQDNLDKTLQIQREKIDSAYYKALIKQDENQKMIIHDIRKHISSVHDLVKNEDYEAALDYMERLYASKELRETVRFSNNHMVNVILNRYATQFLESEMQYNFDIRKDCMENIYVDDITILLCNMLDNAYEGMQGIEDACVELRINAQKSGVGTILSMTNDCSAAAASLKTQKKEKRQFHGYGIKSMNRVAEKYHGNVEVYYSEKEHRFHTIIYLDDKKEAR